MASWEAKKCLQNGLKHFHQVTTEFNLIKVSRICYCHVVRPLPHIQKETNSYSQLLATNGKMVKRHLIILLIVMTTACIRIHTLLACTVQFILQHTMENNCEFPITVGGYI